MVLVWLTPHPEQSLFVLYTRVCFYTSCPHAVCHACIMSRRCVKVQPVYPVTQATPGLQAGETPLLLAAKGGHQTTAELLINKGADVSHGKVRPADHLRLPNHALVAAWTGLSCSPTSCCTPLPGSCTWQAAVFTAYAGVLYGHDGLHTSVVSLLGAPRTLPRATSTATSSA